MGGYDVMIGVGKGLQGGLQNIQSLQQIESNERRQAIDDLKFKELERMEKWKNTYVPVNSIAPELNNYPSARDKMLTMLKSGGFETRGDENNLMVTNAGIQHVLQTMKQDNEATGMMLKSMYTDTQSRLAGINQQLTQVKPDSKDAQTLMQQKAQLESQMSNFVNAMEDVQKAKALEEAKRKEQWSAPYAGPDGSLLRKNLISGKVESVIGRKPETESVSKEDRDKKALIANIYKAHGVSDLEGLRPEIQKRVLEEQVLAEKYLSEGMSVPQATKKAVQGVEQKYKETKVITKRLSEKYSPKKYEGQIVNHPSTGLRFQSDGKNWILVE